MRLNVNVACASRCGSVRKNNEDNFLLNGSCLPEAGDELWPPAEYTRPLDGQELFAVFDGMGGEADGEIASAAAAECLRSIQQRGPISEQQLFSITRELSAAVFARGTELNNTRMGSTMAAMLLDSETAIAVNLGDSPIYVLRGGKLYKVSRDHTDAEEMKRRGITNRKPYLTQYLGVDPEELLLEPFVARIRVLPEDRCLLCSDGLTDMVGEAQIAEILGNAASAGGAAEALMTAALENGGRDNITVIAAVIREQA